MRQITPAESVALGQEGTGNAQILDQIDVYQPIVQLSNLKLDYAVDKQRRENEKVKEISQILSAPEDYFTPDNKEIMQEHESLVQYVAEQLKNKVDVRNPGNFEAFTEFNKRQAALKRKINQSLQDRETWKAALKEFDPQKHDAEIFAAKINDWIHSGNMEERASKDANFLTEKFNPMQLFDVLPDGKIPDTSAKAKLAFGKILDTPQGSQVYLRGLDSPSKIWDSPKAAEAWFMDVWKTLQPKQTSSSKTATAPKDNKKGKKTISFEYFIDQEKANAPTDISQGYDVVDIFDSPEMTVNSFIEQDAEEGSGQIKKQSTGFIPRAIERVPGGEIYFWGQMVPESKNIEQGTVTPEGALKDISVPYKGNETLFRKHFEGTDLQDLPTFLDNSRSNLISSVQGNMDGLADQGSVQYLTTPTTSRTDNEHKRTMLQEAVGNDYNVAVDSKKIVFTDPSGRAVSVSYKGNEDLIERIYRGEAEITELILNADIGVEVTNPDGRSIGAAE